MTIYGLSNNEIHDDQADQLIRAKILKKYPDAVELDRLPEKYETYIHGQGYVLDSEQQEIDEIEQTRIVDIETEKDASELKKITVQQAYDRIDQIFSGATTIAGLRTACVRAFKILVVFILK